MSYNKENALTEIRALSLNSKVFLQDEWRNFLQVALSSIEVGDLETAKDEIHSMGAKLRELGI